MNKTIDEIAFIFIKQEEIKMKEKILIAVKDFEKETGDVVGVMQIPDPDNKMIIFLGVRRLQ